MQQREDAVGDGRHLVHLVERVIRNNDSVILVIHDDGKNKSGKQQIDDHVRHDLALGREIFNQAEDHPDERQFLQQRLPEPRCRRIEHDEIRQAALQQQDQREEHERQLCNESVHGGKLHIPLSVGLRPLLSMRMKIAMKSSYTDLRRKSIRQSC